jgi:hypothetical protein
MSDRPNNQADQGSQEKPRLNEWGRQAIKGLQANNPSLARQLAAAGELEEWGLSRQQVAESHYEVMVKQGVPEDIAQEDVRTMLVDDPPPTLEERRLAKEQGEATMLDAFQAYLRSLDLQDQSRPPAAPSPAVRA